MLNKNNIPLVRGLGGGLGGKAGGLSTFRLIVSDGPVGAHSAYCPAALAGPALFPHEQATWYWKKIERWFQEFYCDITIVLFFQIDYTLWRSLETEAVDAEEGSQSAQGPRPDIISDVIYFVLKTKIFFL